MDLVPVARYDSAGQAHLAKSLLDDAGIPCTLSGEHQALLTSFFSRSAGGIGLLVPEDRLEEARIVLGTDFELEDED